MKLEFVESQSEYTDRPLFFFGRLKSCAHHVLQVLPECYFHQHVPKE